MHTPYELAASCHGELGCKMKQQQQYLSVAIHRFSLEPCTESLRIRRATKQQPMTIAACSNTCSHACSRIGRQRRLSLLEEMLKAGASRHTCSQLWRQSSVTDGDRGIQARQVQAGSLESLTSTRCAPIGPWQQKRVKKKGQEPDPLKLAIAC